MDTLKITEFEIQSLVYNTLKQHGFNVRGEYRVYSNELHRAIVADLPIFDVNSNLKLIIEIKRSENSKSVRQGKLYFDVASVPVIYIRGMKDAENLFEILYPYLYLI